MNSEMMQQLLNESANLFNVLLPIFIIITGLTLGVAIMRYVRDEINKVLPPLHTTITVEAKPKRKNDEMFIPAEMPEKPKRQIVRVGDDGELIYDDAITNS